MFKVSFLFFLFFVLILTEFRDVKNTPELFPKYCGENRLLILTSVQQVINSGPSNHMLEPWCWTAQMCETSFSGLDLIISVSWINIRKFKWSNAEMKLCEKSGLGVPAGSCRATLWDQRHAVTASLRDRRRDSSAIHSELFRFVSFRPSHSYAVRVIRRDVSLLRNSIFQEVKKKRYFGYLSFRRDFNLLQLRCFCRVLSDFQAVLTFSFSRCFHKNRNKNKAYLFKLPCPGWEVFCGLFSGCPDVLRYRVPESRGLQVQPLLFLRSSAADP